MKITKDLQNYLGIISILIQKDGKDYLCFLSRFSDSFLTLEIATKLDFSIKEEIAIQFNFKDNTEQATALILDHGMNYCKVMLLPPTPLSVSHLIEKLSIMIQNDEKYGRRKEPRFKLGLSGYMKFNLASKEQTVFSSTFKFIQPCVLMDVSMLGVCILTSYTPAINKLENFKIKVSFINPIETIIIDAHKVYVNITRYNNKEYAIISCQLLEPINFVWKEQIVFLSNI